MHLPWRDVAPGDGPLISTSVTEAEAGTLAALARGRTVLEVGSAFGYSACVMALAGAEHIVSVDPHDWIPKSLETMEANIEAYDVGMIVEIADLASQHLMPEMHAAGRRFDLIFVDGDHREPAVRHDIKAALGLLEPRGILACHDYLETCCCPDVRPVVDEFFPAGGGVTDTLFVVSP